MATGPKCQVCQLPPVRLNRLEIERYKGRPIKHLATEFGVHEDALGRHFKNHITTERDHELIMIAKREKDKEAAEAVNDVIEDGEIEVQSTFNTLAKRVGKILDRAEAAEDPGMSLAAAEGLRKILRDLAEMQGKLNQRTSITVSLTDSPEWQVVQRLMQEMFVRHPDAKETWIALSRRQRAMHSGTLAEPAKTIDQQIGDLSGD